MILYHGSLKEISLPDVYHSRNKLDFGKGFYLTPIKEQALSWALRRKRQSGKKAVISAFDLDIDVCRKNFHVLEFVGYTEQWLEFIASCRSLTDNSNFDMIIGSVADDRIFDTLELFFEGFIDKKEAMNRLRYTEPNLQICIRSQIILSQYLKFIRSEAV